MRRVSRGLRWVLGRRAFVGVVAALAVVVAVPSVAHAQDGGTPAEIETYLRRHMADVRTPGLAFAIVRGDEVVQQAAWGVDGDGRPLTAQTPFVLGSTSKSFTALAVMQLVERGLVELDAPVRRYVPWFRLADEDAAARITVRQLLIQTSGLPDVATRGFTDRYDSSPGGLERSVRDLAAVRPTALPGEVHQYSDANYMILGVLVEEVTGESFGGYLRRAVLDPLEMTHSAATEAEARDAGLTPGYRHYFGRPQRFAPPFDTSGVPYGFLAASLEDVTHYAIAHLNDGRYRDAEILSAQGVAQLHNGQTPTGTRGSYGFGWRDTTLDGTDIRLVWHAGAVANSFSHIVIVPASDLAVIVLTNSYSLAMDGLLTSAAFNVVRILHGGSPVAATADSVFTWALVGLLAVTTSLLAALMWSVVQAVRRRGVPSRHRVAATTVLWLIGCAAVAAGAAWAVPASWDGAHLEQVMLFAPDIGHAILAVAASAVLLALTRLGVAAHAVARRRRVLREQSPGR